MTESVRYSDVDPLRKYRNQVPFSTIFITIVFTVFGLSLIFQSGRWAKTPSYGNLLNILSADVWGYIHLGIAVVLIIGLLLRRFRLLTVIAHTLAFILFAVWEFAFIIRYLTDSGTTIVNVISWITYLTIVVWSARAMDRQILA